ncbi:hypothetical protein MRX96_020971 [Rhipicephalus microplus]
MCFTAGCIDWLPVVGGWLVKAWSYYAYVIVFCGSVVKDDAVRLAFIVGFHVLMALLLWSELTTIATPPPNVPAYFSLSEVDLRLLQEARTEEARKGFLEVLGQQRGVLTRGLDGAVSYCEVCERIKPDRAHHCSVCRRCVLKMDHHCPWFNNCVCFSTYKGIPADQHVRHPAVHLHLVHGRELLLPGALEPLARNGARGTGQCRGTGH